MAQVQEVKKEGLQREFNVTISQDIFAASLLTRLNEIGKTAKLPGFRPGKIPMKMLQQNYGANARAEVLDKIVSDITDKTLSERNLRPAMQPKIELVSFTEDKDIEFKLALEVLPEVIPADFSKIKLERLVADVEDKTIEEAITRAAKSMREPEAAPEGSQAKDGDVLVIDFDGSVDGERQPGMKAEGHHLTLGSHSFIDTFEEQLVGSKVGDNKTITVTFPADYHAKNLAGKKADFIVDVKEILVPKPVTMDDEMAKEIGFPSFDVLRERVKEDIASNYQRISRALIKRQLMDKLAEAHSFEIPSSLLEAEFGSIWQQIEDSKAKGELPEEDKAKTDEQLRTEYRAIAERRIRLGLLLAEVAQTQKIAVDPNALRKALTDEARRFPGQEKAVFDYYTQTQGAMERLRAPLLEEKVVDYIVSQTNVTEKKISAEDLLKTPEDMD